jgi:hypothetical protein
MPRPKRKIEAEVVIDGVKIVWHLHREQQSSTEHGWGGVAIHAKVATGVFRELHLEYPPTRTHKQGWSRIDPVQQNIQGKKVEGHIRLAIEAGWDPASRGKPFVYEVGELPG